MGKRVPRTKGGETLTEAQFWGGIRSALRQKSRFWWKPIQATKNAARRAYRGSNKRQKWEYQCAECKDWFQGKEVQVDHLVEAGSLKCGADLEGFVERLFCEQEGLQVLCKGCHQPKTNKARK